MIKLFRNPVIGWSLITIHLTGLLLPYSVEGSSEPGQPEIQNFTPNNVTELVDPFTGDFTYNINVMDVGGYPINLSYRSGINMNDEASFVGFGWVLNPGAINRKVRGLPDDFKADTIEKEFNMRPDLTIGMGVGANYEVFGFDAGKLGVGLQLGVNKNSYRGYGLDISTTQSANIGVATGNSKLSGSLSLGLGLSSSQGAYLSPYAGLGYASSYADQTSKVGIGAGTKISSREGLKEVSFNASYTRNLHKNLRYGTKKTTSIAGSFPISFASPTFLPTSNLPMRNISVSTRFKLGVEVYGNMLDLFGSGYFSLQELSKNNEELLSYGYMYAHEAPDGRVLNDFNREKDGPYQKQLPALPLTNFTYDIYAVSGQGIDGQFRPFRGDIGILSDPYSSSETNSINAGGEVALGNLVHGGVDLVVNSTRDHTKTWKDENGLYNAFKFQGEIPDNPAYEPVYFQSVGEKTAMENTALFERLGGFDPVYAPVKNGSVENQLVNNDVTVNITEEQSYKNIREPRNVHFSYLNAEEADRMAVIKNIESFKGRSVYINDITLERWYNLVADTINRNNEDRKPHHLSELTVTRDDGTRYVYGLPVYGKQKEVTFNVSKKLGTSGAALPVNPSTSFVSYTPGVDNSVNNDRGLDQYFVSESTPAHASSFLLTSILSDDYVDVTGNGPSSDDFGNYTRFNYTQAHSNFRWRIPYEQNQAQFDKGYESDKLDDKGSYVYGEKEIWYIHSIETKNFVAEFTLSDREDGHCVIDENGGRSSSMKLKKLDRIELYTQSDRIKNGPLAIPIKTVHFKYDYSLCDNVPGSSSGKLTLKKVSFTYGNSYKGKLSPYQFSYSDVNPGYHPKESDRWGTYKLNDPVMDNRLFPYTRQEDVTNDHASAWQLTQVKLPSGGIVNIKYESDDYALVQNRKAMEMVPVLGIRNSSAGTTPIGPGDNQLYMGPNPNRYLFFGLKTPTNNPDELYEYIKGIRELYFNCRVNTSPMYGFERIKGFIPMNETQVYGEDYGFFEGGRSGINYNIGWIRLPVMEMGDTDKIASGLQGAHPIARATWQQLRKSQPRVAYDKPEPTSLDDFNDFDALIAELSSLVESANRALNGFNEWMRDNNRGQRTDNEKSFIRLNTPDGKKYGGGSRVKFITISDEWGNMVPGVPEIKNFSYGQEYIYTTEESFGDSTRTISSGVASYEPSIGGDENGFVLPSRYRIAKPLALDLNLYLLEPFGESFFPASSIGYSKVIIKNLSHEGVNRTATGFTQHEFYTAKDFPTLTSQTKLHAVPFETPPTPFYSELNATVSQGYVIELNDMHGKPKAKKVFQEINDDYPISGVEYIYHTEEENPSRLKNRVTVFDETTGTTSEKLVGVTYDFVVDAREMKRETWGPGVQINTDGFMASIIPIFVAIPYPDLSYSKSQYRGLVTTKVIQRSGLVKEVIAYDLGSRITTQNLVYDGKTGKLLIAKIQNEFEDDHFNTNLPAHWVHDGMGNAFKNIGIAYRELTANAGIISVSDANSTFIRGDELLLQRKDIGEPVTVETGGTPAPVGERLIPYQRGWVYRVGEHEISIIDRLGQPIENGVYDLKIIRSGRKNMQSVSLGSVATKSDPLATGSIDFTEVLDATAIEFDEHWQTYAGFLVPLPESTCICETELGDFQGSITYVATLSILHELLISGDYKSDSIALDRGAYQNGYLNYAVGYGTKIYYGEVNGNFVEAAIRNEPSTGEPSQCDIRMEMADGSVSFPDSIINVTYYDPLFDREDFTCNGLYNFNLLIEYVNEDGEIKQAVVKFSSGCFKILDCSESLSEFPPMTCDIADGDLVNPFLLGILGNWRPKANYTYITSRTSGRIDEEGVFTDFDSFWSPLNFTLSPAADKTAWQWAKKNTISDPFGNSLEQVDPLNRYTSSIYGYGLNLPIVSAENARYHQLAFDGFEDYEYRNVVESPFDECPLPPHWKFDPLRVHIDTNNSHTGKRSLRVEGDEAITSVITPLCDPDARSIPVQDTYPIQDCDLIRKFAPPAGEYVLQAWVKEDHSPSDIVTRYENTTVLVSITSSSGITNSFTFQPSGQIIDGWQPLEANFTIPSDSESISIALQSSRTAYFDDIRIQPKNSTGNSYVYDPVSLRPIAVLDDRNYATFYEYDPEGILVRTKKETERGILTLQEVRSATPKAY